MDNECSCKQRIKFLQILPFLNIYIFPAYSIILNKYLHNVNYWSGLFCIVSANTLATYGQYIIKHSVYVLGIVVTHSKYIITCILHQSTQYNCLRRNYVVKSFKQNLLLERFNHQHFSITLIRSYIEFVLISYFWLIYFLFVFFRNQRESSYYPRTPTKSCTIVESSFTTIEQNDNPLRRLGKLFVFARIDNTGDGRRY